MKPLTLPTVAKNGKPGIPRADIVTTLVRTDREAIKAIQRLNLRGSRFDLDPTYSKGVFWKGLEGPRLKFDLFPQVEGVMQGDARHLPLPDWSIDSVMFDPPFIAKDVTKRRPNGKIEKRFGGYRTIPELFQFYRDALIEFRRLLRPYGFLVFKCQDVVSGGKQHFSHCNVWEMAKEIGYIPKDLYIKYNPNVMISPNMANQQHARRTHCYFWVFQR